MNTFLSRLNARLEARKASGELRTLRSFNQITDFFSNDYLGLARAEQSFNIENKSSVGSSRLIAGTTELHLEFEEELAKHFYAESALLFNSGYSANLGLFSAIGLKDTVVLFDEYAHASIKDGIRLSFAKAYSFKHNDCKHLERLLTKHKNQSCIVVTESLFSMHGDFAPLKEIAVLSQQFNAQLIVDEAHSGGVFGRSGYCVEEQIHDATFARIFTFGKAYGATGACVLGSKTLIDYLINFSRPFIYTTALPYSIIQESKKKILETEHSEKQELLRSNIHKFRQTVNSDKLISSNDSPIQSLVIGDTLVAKKIEDALLKKEIAVKAILSPTVPKGQECIRISIHSFNTSKEIDTLVTELKPYL